MEETLLILTSLLLVSFLISEMFYRLRYSRVVGQIIAGIIIGLPLFASFIFPEGNYFLALQRENFSAMIIESLSGLGVIFLLLLTGLEIDYRKLKEVSRDAGMIAFFAAIIPFVLGFASIEILGDMGYIPGVENYNIHIVALIVGICLSITAEGTKIMILMELDKLNSRIGEIMLGAGIMDDIFEVIFLSLVLILVSGTAASPISQIIVQLPGLEGVGQEVPFFQFLLFPIGLMLFVVLSYSIFKVLPWIVRYIQSEKSEVSEFMIVILIGLLIAMLSWFLGLGTIIGAFIAGLIIQMSIKDKEEEMKLVNDLKVITIGLIVPFFFLSIGLSFDINSIFLNPLLLLMIILVAIIGKILGSIIAKPFTQLSLRQLYLIGWGMNSRGAVELVIAFVAYPLLPREVFSSIVVMAVLTTLVFPLILRYEIKKNPEIMD